MPRTASSAIVIYLFTVDRKREVSSDDLRRHHVATSTTAFILHGEITTNRISASKTDGKDVKL
jgi:hypothetical protein